MVIAGELPKVDLAEILAMTRDGSRNQKALVVVDEREQVLGGCIYREFSICSAFELNLIAVKASCQGFGLGSALVRNLLYLSPKVQVCASAQNLSFFKRFGFCEVAQDSLLNGTRVSNPDFHVLMFKKFQSKQEIISGLKNTINKLEAIPNIFKEEIKEKIKEEAK